MTTITVMSRCHEYEGEWTPEREPLGKTLSDIGGMPPAFDFYTPPEPSAYDRIKACPRVREKVTVYARKAERDRVSAPRKAKAKPRAPETPLQPFREVCDTVGILPNHLTYLVRSGMVRGNMTHRLASLSSVEAYMATR